MVRCMGVRKGLGRCVDVRKGMGTSRGTQSAEKYKKIIRRTGFRQPGREEHTHARQLKRIYSHTATQTARRGGRERETDRRKNISYKANRHFTERKRRDRRTALTFLILSALGHVALRL